jgi:hypothetical protein
VSLGEHKSTPRVAPNVKLDGNDLTPEIRSWIVQCLVPILLDEYLEQRKSEAQNSQIGKGLLLCRHV